MDIFSTAALVRLVPSLVTRYTAPFILNRYFNFQQMSDTEEIMFDTEEGRRRISPFVAPFVAGKIVESNGYSTNKFKPAYVKDKRIFKPRRSIKFRVGGEQIAGTLSPLQRQQLLLAQELSDQISMAFRRQEVMAVEALRKGGVTVEGDQYPKTYVNYGRDAALTITLSGAARWGQAGVSALDNLESWALLVTQKSGAVVTEVVMDIGAWGEFISDPEVKEELSRFRGTSTLTTDATVQTGATYKGQARGFDIYVYVDWYVDPADGIEKPMMPAGTVLMISQNLDGVRAYGAIEDEEAGLQAMQYFPKSWTEKDPPVRYLMLQSAPLPVPYRPNACACATVI